MRQIYQRHPRMGFFIASGFDQYADELSIDGRVEGDSFLIIGRRHGNLPKTGRNRPPHPARAAARRQALQPQAGRDRTPVAHRRAGAREAADGVWRTIVMPDVHDMFAPILYAIPAQLLAYHTAVRKGTDVDQPRNLAKSVTVE